MRTRFDWLILTGILLFGFENRMTAGDWPMWRYDSRRGSSSPEDLPADMALRWTRQLPEPLPAWPREQGKLQFDRHSEPVVMGRRIFVPSNRHDSVTAFDTGTGEELWCFHADGPVRFAPVAAGGRVFFNSDDGFLYAVSAENGKLLWKVNGGPGERRILGNHRLISSWPARGGVVLHEGKLFFSASIWPFMGIFLHAVDPETGEILWTNSGDGTNYTIQPHDAPSFAGLVPQGHLAADGDTLVVPGGRSTPGLYDVATGRQMLFNYDKKAGGHDVGIVGNLIFTAGHAYTRSHVRGIGGGAPAVFDEKAMLASDPQSMLGRAAEVELGFVGKLDKRGKVIKEATVSYRELFKTELESPIPGKWFLKAGERYYAGGEGRVAAYEVGKRDPVWSAGVDGVAASMLAADERLFVVTADNRLSCFGADDVEKVVHHQQEGLRLPEKSGPWTEKAARILEREGIGHGYGIVLGIGNGRLIEELVRQSELHLVAIDSDPGKVGAFRDRMTKAGLYGERCAAILDDPLSASLPPYVANLIVSESLELGEAGLETVFHSLRPYGGTAFLALSLADRVAAKAMIDQGRMVNAKAEGNAEFVTITRAGALPDTDDWTHQYANAAQTVVSRDHHVKAPFGALWFGGPSHEGILPRHGHGPSPQVAGGRLFIEGPDMLRAVDVYTGRLLWERELKGFGEYYDTTDHFAGAGEIGSNYVSLPDWIYAVHGSRILELDTRNGQTQREFQLPAPAPDEPAPFWGHAVVSGDFLIATSTPIAADAKPNVPSELPATAMKIIPQNAIWSYLASGREIKNWRSAGFEESVKWPKGAAGFGYGDEDDKTVLDLKGKTSRIFIRHVFEGTGVLEKIERLALRIRYDDGFVAYLNGKEIARAGVKALPGGNFEVSSHEATGFDTFEVNDWRELIHEGGNVLAIEGHNRSKGSSDFTLDPYLVGIGAEAGGEVKIPTARFASGSRRLVVYDRKSGDLLWEREAVFNFRHNNIAVSDDRIFCIDRMTPQRAGSLARRGITMKGSPALYALDLRTGRVLWESHEEVFGTFLNYSAEHDVLLQGGSAFRDRAADETGSGLMALRGSSGEIVWHLPELVYHGPCLLWRDQILTNGNGGFGLDLLTGKKTGWEYSRMYGCNTAVGSEHLLTFRSGAAGFFDLAGNSGTGNLGGFKSSCTNNLIPANGVLSAPDYTRTCTCSYQNQTSLALIHMPEAEFWTFGGRADPKRFGINFGAPGDRRSEEGTLFCEYPETGGKSDSVGVKIEGKNARYPRVHASMMRGSEPRWIAASCVEGASRLEIDLPAAFQNSRCRLRFWFAELEGAKPGERCFDVVIDGDRKVANLDVASAAGLRQGVAKVIDDLKTGTVLTVEFFPVKGSRGAILSGIELVRL